MAAWLVAAGAARAGAQEAADGAVRSTAGGVYTEPQAKRGKDVYALSCTGCHVVTSHTGPAFVNGWNGKPLAALLRYVSELMPKSDPGGLSPQQYADVVAYLLKLNGAPSGASELPSDGTGLEKVRIEIKAREP